MAAARRAVMALEAHISIQGVVVRDQRAHRWKRRDLLRDRSLDSKQQADFIVSISGDRQMIDRARKLLHPEPAA